MITEMARGMTLDDAMNITRKDVADELDGLPAIKMHCSNLAADALKAAIANYRGEDSGDEEHYHDDECKDGDNGGGGVCTSCVRKSDSEEEKKAE
jgi:nitrogen fixation NifU-like protein